MLARNAVTSAEVDLVCALNKDRGLDQELHRLQLSPAQASKGLQCRRTRVSWETQRLGHRYCWR